MYEIKNNRAIGIILFRADNYAVVIEILLINHGTKEIERRAIEIQFVNHMVHFSFQIGPT